MNKGTKTTLVVELDKKLADLLNSGEPEGSLQVGRLLAIIEQAKNGDFHDYESEIDTPFPKMKLYDYLSKAGLDDLALKVKQGEYDEDPFEKEGGKNDN